MTVRPETLDRSTFLRRAGVVLAAGFIDRSTLARLFARRAALEHPEPRDGITSEHVLSIDALGSSRSAKVLEEYESARAYPAMFDGVACACSCGGKHGMHRSLLACYETLQPTGCGGCQEEADIVGRLAREGKPLADIRKAVDKWAG